MPTYLARGVSARLGAMPLIDTISPQIIPRKGEMAKQQAETAERLLRDSKLLNEVSVPFPGDGKQHSLNWLGNAPFIQVQARWNVSGEECPDTTKTPIGAPTAREVKALVLHINLSERTYISGLSNKKTSLKIEVFFNGQLSNCWLMSTHDVRSGVRGHHQVFAGTRADFLAERPWVILPFGLAPDGGFETNYKFVSVLQRWQDICQAIQNEAHERGINEAGEISPTAKFLKALATMQMPDLVYNIQKPGGKVFGTIDVIITAGEGKKLTSGVGYLKAPKRMSDENFPFVPQSDSDTVNLPTARIKQNSSDSERHNPEPGQRLFGLDAKRDCHREHDFHPKRRALGSSNFSSEHQTATPSSLECAQLNSHSQILDDVQHLEASSAHQCMATPSGSYRNASRSLHTSPVHSSLWNSPSYTTRGPSRSDYSNIRLSQESTALYSRPLHFFHVNVHDPSYPPSMLCARDMNIDLKSIGHNTLPMPYSSAQKPMQIFSHTKLSAPKNHLLEAAGWSTKEIQCFTPIPHPMQMAPSLLSRKIPGWLPVSVSPNGHLTWPVPPVGLYSVPRKPNQSTSSRKDTISAQMMKYPCDTFLSRVVILGKHKTILVEHQWDPPKRLRAGLATPISQHNHSVNTNGPLESVECENTSATIHKPASIPVRRPDSSCEEETQPDCDRPHRALPSRTSILSVELPQRQIHISSKSKSSISRKRKTVHHAAVNKARSPPGLKTDDNPPLNQGCIIAYAESKDKNNQQSVLRQVRSERLGVFQEDYVVFATRFFIGEE